MSDVYVYVKPPPCAVLGDLRTVQMEGGVNLDYDRDDGELVGVEILGAVHVEVDGDPVVTAPAAPDEPDGDALAEAPRFPTLADAEELVISHSAGRWVPQGIGDLIRDEYRRRGVVVEAARVTAQKWRDMRGDYSSTEEAVQLAELLDALADRVRELGEGERT